MAEFGYSLNENDHLPDKTSDDHFLQKLIDEFYKTKKNREPEVSFMTQAVHDRDMRMEGFEDAEAMFKPMLKEKNQQLAGVVIYTKTIKSMRQMPCRFYDIR